MKRRRHLLFEFLRPQWALLRLLLRLWDHFFIKRYIRNGSARGDLFTLLIYGLAVLNFASLIRSYEGHGALAHRVLALDLHRCLLFAADAGGRDRVLLVRVVVVRARRRHRFPYLQFDPC